MMMNKKENFIIASSRRWNRRFFDDIKKNSIHNFFWVESDKSLRHILKVKKDIRYIFFFHWNTILSKEIYSEYECVCFHMTDLPYGRGGSPLQNLIKLGFKKTKISAFKMDNGIDSGPIYCKKDLSLDGNARDIYLRCSKASVEIINWIIKKNPKPKKQNGNIFKFDRRTPEMSEIDNNINFNKLYDHIRMLDAPGYPKAFIQLKDFIIEFDNAKKNDQTIIAKATIKLKK